MLMRRARLELSVVVDMQTFIQSFLVRLLPEKLSCKCLGLSQIAEPCAMLHVILMNCLSTGLGGMACGPIPFWGPSLSQPLFAKIAKLGQSLVLRNGAGECHLTHQNLGCSGSLGCAGRLQEPQEDAAAAENWEDCFKSWAACRPCFQLSQPC